MAQNQDISVIISPEAEAALGRTVTVAKEGATAMAEFAKQALSASTALGSSKTLLDYAKASTEAAKAQTALANANLALARSESEVLRQLELEEKVRTAEARTLAAQASARTAEARTIAATNRERDRANKLTATATAQAEREVKAAGKLLNAYELLKKEYKAVADEAKKLGAEYGVNDERAKAAFKSAKALNDRLIEIESGVGQNQRNVGNYRSAYDGIGMQVQGLLREVPSVQNLNQLFLSWSNQLPLLGDAIAKATGELKEFKAAAEAANAAQIAAQAAQTGAQAAADATAESLGEQIDSVVGTVAASREQAIALKEQIGEQIAASGASLEAAAAAGVNTEALLINAGASVEDAAAIGAQVRANGANAVAAANATVALEAQTVATAEATAAQTAQLSVGARLLKSIFSINSLLTVGVLLLTVYGAQAAGAVVDALDSTTEAAKRLAKQQELTNVAIEGASSEMAKAIANVERVREAFLNAERGIITKESALKAYNDTLGKSMGEVDSLAEAERRFTAQADSYIEYTFKKALANTAFQKSAEKAVEAQFALNKPLEDNLGAWRKFTVMAQQYFTGGTSQVVAAFDDVNEKIKGLKEESDIFKQIGIDAQDTADILKELYGFDPETLKKGKDATIADTLNAEINARERLNKALAERNVQEIEQAKEAQQRIFEDEQKSLNERLEARQQYYFEELSQQYVASQLELQNIDLNLSKIQKIEGKAASKRTAQEKTLIIQKEAFEAERTVIVEKYAAQASKAERENNKFAQDAITKETEKQIAFRRALLDNNISYLKANLSAQETEERAALNKRYATGRINETQYREQLETLNKAYDMSELEGARDLTMAKMQELQNLGADTEKEEKQLADIITKINDEKNAKIEAGDMKAARRGMELLRAIGQVAQELSSAITTIRQAEVDKELAALQKRGEEIDKNKDKEIAAINLTAATQEEKQRLIQVAEAKSQAQREQLAQRETEMRQRQARFERAVTIGEIIAKTALAVVSALPNIPLSIAAGVIGALQLATAIARPLPAYEEGAGIPGRPEHKGGFARVGEKGRTEYIIEPGKQPYAVNSDHVRYLRKGTKVIPQARLNSMGYDMLSPSMIGNIQQQRQDNSEVVDVLRQIYRKKSPQTNINIKLDPGQRAYIDKNCR